MSEQETGVAREAEAEVEAPEAQGEAPEAQGEAPPRVDEAAVADAADPDPAGSEAPDAQGEPHEARREPPDAAAHVPEKDLGHLARIVEALLFLSSDPVSLGDLAEAAEASKRQIADALLVLEEQLAPGARGLQIRQIGGGWALASSPEAEDAARRLFSRPRIATLTPAQTETLAIVAYLQPISRPEISRIRGVSADSAAATLLERGLIEEAGRSQFGAALYRTTPTFLKLFGLVSLNDLPDVAQWDPSPEEQAELRDRLLRAGEARAGGAPPE